MSLPSSHRSIGEKAVTTLPANRSLILADSRYRVDNPADEPYNFTCNLGGTGIYAKEIYYLKLYWNQPIFAHNNTSSELRFQMFGDTATTYIVYATPFLMYTAYDGNPEGTSLLTPQLYSYASNMELGLNGDIRTYPNNTTLINGDGIMRDPLNNIVNMRFRYSPSRGFCIYPEQNFALYPAGYSIKLLPCNYIANAHFVHGFGIFDPAVDDRDYTPYNFFTAAYWSDTTPNLLPMRYIVIQSPELNKDRRMISFHNGNFANFVNELSIFALNPARTGVFHELATGDDATVVSLRDDYTPQRFRISILDEYGDQITCDDPIRNMLNREGIPLDLLSSFLFGPLSNRGKPLITDILTFGFGRIQGGQSPVQPKVMTTKNKNTGYPDSMQWISWPCFYAADNKPNVADIYNTSLGIYSNQSIAPTGNISPNVIGFQRQNLTKQFGGIQFYPATIWKWWPTINSNPGLEMSLPFRQSIVDGHPSGWPPAGVTPYMIMVEWQTGKWIGYTSMPYSQASLFALNVYGNYSTLGGVGCSWTWNPDYPLFNLSPSSFISVAFFYSCVYTDPSSVPQSFENIYAVGDTQPPDFNIYNLRNYPNIQNQYIPPVITPYEFGNPQASALCEELIHEIAAINEYN